MLVSAQVNIPIEEPCTKLKYPFQAHKIPIPTKAHTKYKYPFLSVKELKNQQRKYQYLFLSVKE
jgi:hypothetical protein